MSISRQNTPFPKKHNQTHQQSKDKRNKNNKKNQLQAQLYDNKLKMDKAKQNIQKMKADLRVNRFVINQIEKNIRDLIRSQHSKQQNLAEKKEFDEQINKYRKEITLWNVDDLEISILIEKEKLQSLNEQRKNIIIESRFDVVLSKIDEVKEKAAHLYNINFSGLDVNRPDNILAKSLMMMVMQAIETVELEIKNFTQSETRFDTVLNKKVELNVNANKFNFKKLEKAVERALEDIQMVHGSLEELKGKRDKRLVQVQVKILQFVKELQRIFEDMFRDIKQLGKEMFVPERVAAEDRQVREKLEANRSQFSTKTSYQTKFKDKLEPERFKDRLHHSVKSMAKKAQTKVLGTEQQTQELDSTYMGDLLKGYRSKIGKGNTKNRENIKSGKSKPKSKSKK